MKGPYRESGREPSVSELAVTLDLPRGGVFDALLRTFRLGGRRRAPVLRIVTGELELRDVPGVSPSARAPLGSLHDVMLDTKVVRRILEGDSPVPVVRFLEGKPGPESSISRIQLVFEDGRTVALGEDYVPHLVATEWLGKVRVFLRHHGWVPRDERPATS